MNSTTRWYFQPIFDNYLLPLGLILGLFVLLFLIRPVFRSVSKKRLATLTWLRCAAIACVLLAMLRPTIVSTQTRPVPATLALLVDSSRSMQTEDVGESSRWSEAKRLVKNVSPDLRSLGESYSVQGFLFQDSLSELAASEEEALFALPETPEGGETNIGAALHGLIQNQSGKRLAGVILVSDGAQRAIETKHDAGQLAQQLARMGCPLYTVTLGKSRDRSKARDVAIENFEDQYTVFAKNELVVRASVFSQGYVGQKIPVELEITNADGESETLGPVLVRATEDNESLEVRFAYTPIKPGQYSIVLRAAPQPGERITDNNSMQAFLQVIEGGLRVLYICGNIGWQEHNLIRRSMDESLDIQLDFLWVDRRRRRDWPVNLLKLIQDNAYDVFILADVDQAAIGQTQCDLLAAQVEEGKGLMMTGGVHSFAPGGYSGTALDEVLPIELRAFDRQQFDKPVRPDVHINSELKLIPTAPHFTTRLTQSSNQSAAWDRLPPMRGANKLDDPKDTATVLLESAQSDPILIAGQYGLGRALAFAGDSTYRWYRYGFQEEHKRFWRQVILWLAQKENDTANDVWLNLDQRRYAAGSRVDFHVGASDAEGADIKDARFEVALVGPAGGSTKIPVSKGKPISRRTAWTGATTPITKPGTYTIQVRGFQGDSPIGETESQFIVVDQDIELADPTADPAQMAMLAGITAESGGKTLAPEEVSTLLQNLRDKPIEAVTQFESRWQLTDTVFDAWALFLLIVGLLCTEWYLRKKWSLV